VSERIRKSLTCPCASNQTPGYEDVWRSGDELHAFLTSTLDVSGQIHDPAALLPGKSPR